MSDITNEIGKVTNDLINNIGQVFLFSMLAVAIGFVAGRFVKWVLDRVIFGSIHKLIKEGIYKIQNIRRGKK